MKKLAAKKVFFFSPEPGDRRKGEKEKRRKGERVKGRGKTQLRDDTE